MNKNIAASLLPVVFALASIGAVGCAAESELSGDVAAEREPSAAAMPAEALAGSAGTPAVATPAPATDTRVGTTASTLRLAVTEKGATTAVMYDVLDFDFGVDSPTVTSGGSGDLSVGKPSLRPFNVVVRPNPKSAVLGKSLSGVTRLAKVVLQRLDAAGKAIDLAQLDLPAVSRMSTEASDETQEKYELQTPVLTVKENGAAVTVDLVKGVTSCTGKCTCVTTNPGQLGPYTQSGPLGTVAADSTRIDEVSVELHNDIVPSSTGGLSTTKAVLDGIRFERSLETSGLCAMYYAGTGKHVVDVRIGVAGPVQPNGVAIESTTWDACYATVKGVGFAGSSGEAPREKVDLAAAGLVRTDRSFDPNTGLLLKGTPTTSGWSFVRNVPITSCAATLL